MPIQLPHDLKEPLAVMLLTSNMITKIADLTRDELKEYLRQINSTAYQMNTIVNSLLLFARVSKAEVSVENVDREAHRQFERQRAIQFRGRNALQLAA